MAITPAKPDFKDVTSRGRCYVWFTPTMAATTAETIVTPLKRIICVDLGSRPNITWTSSAGAAGTTVVTISATNTSSCTGGNTPLVIYGQ